MYLSLTALKNMNIVDKEFPVASGSVSNITQSMIQQKPMVLSWLLVVVHYAHHHQHFQIKYHSQQPMDIDNKFKNGSRNVTLRVRLTPVLIKNCR